MIDFIGAATGFAIMLGLMSLGLHVATAMFLVSVLGASIYLGPNILMTFGTQLWSTMNDFILTAIPLFILLGELLLRSGVTQRMYGSLSDWLNALPGGLLHTNIGASGLFAAVSGSSVATAATIGTIALPELNKRGYNERWILGTVAAGGTLGILIPPSVNLIIYGAMTDTSIGKLFIGGVVPGVLLILLFMLIVMIASIFKPGIAGTRDPKIPLREKLQRLRYTLPPLAIFLVVMGSIYFGWATPTEAAAVGVLMATALAGFNRCLTVNMLHHAFRSMVKMASLILLIIVAAFYLNFVTGVLGIPQAMTKFVADVGGTPMATLWLLVVFYLLLGCFLETMSMMVATIPVVFPVIVHLGIDPVWFGIFLVLMMEMALITPPVGMNLYVVQGVRGRGKISDVFYGVAPFIIMIFVLVAAIIFVPSIVTWLPDMMV